ASTTTAAVGDGAKLTTPGTVSVVANSNLIGTASAGGLALGLGAGVGASLAANLGQHLTQATVGNAQIDANGAITIEALATEGFGSTALAGSAAVLGSLAGSISLDAGVVTTQATVGVGAQLNQVAPPSAAQTITVLAQDATTLIGRAGV